MRRKAGVPVTVLVPIAFALFGLIFGSFANVVIHRLPRGESLSFPASHCPVCDAPIAWYDNVPVVSWVALRGRCRACAAPISVRYPLVEAASGALWLLAWVLFDFTLRAGFAVVFFYLLLILAAIDLDTFRLPNALVATLAGVGAAGVATSLVTGVPATPLLGGGNPAASAVLGAVLSAGTAFGIAMLYAAMRKMEGFGMGDVKLLGAIGVFLGVYGLMVLFVGSVLGAVVGIAQAVRSGKGLTVKIPFGPFLAAAAIIVSGVGPAVWSWYWGLIA